MKEKKTIFAAVLGIAAFAILFSFLIFAGLKLYDLHEAQKDIADKIIRFHVRADSDSDEDQEIKLKVRDKVVSYLNPKLIDSTDINQSRDIIEDNILNIQRCAEEELRDCGCGLTANVYLTREYFPYKVYGDAQFPPGIYEALRVDIGSAKGHNWWCVLYPPLCFSETNDGKLPEESKDKLKNVLPEDEYSEITGKQYTYRFKYLTFLNDWLGL